MAEQTELEQAAERLRKTATEFACMDFEKLQRKDLGKEASFEPLQDSFRGLQSMAKRMAQCSWTGTPIPVIQTCEGKLLESKGILQNILNFNLMRSGNPSGERAAYISSFLQRWAEIYVYVSLHLCYAESVDSGADQYKNAMEISLTEANQAKEKFEKSLADQQESMKADQERMQGLVAEVERMAKDAGVTNQAVHFKALADSYGKAAIYWMAAAFVAGIGLYFYVSNLHDKPSATTTLGLAAEIMPRLITVTLLSTALIFFIRNFSAAMHNKTVNRHRQTALTTFKTFVGSTEDPSTKNAVLVQATQAIFAPQPSGYLKTDQEMPQMNQVTEIVRGVTGKEK